MTKIRGQLGTSFMTFTQLQQCKNQPYAILIKFEVHLKYNKLNKTLSSSFLLIYVDKYVDRILKF
jgi:hypothetical protein